MTPKEWAAVVAAEPHNDAQAIRPCLLAMADEPWLSEEWAQWVRDRADFLECIQEDRSPTLDLVHYWIEGNTKLYPYWVQSKLIDEMGRVDCFEKECEAPYGSYTRNSTREGAWCMLLEAIQSLSTKEVRPDD